MNIVEMFLFLLALFLSIFLGRYFVRQIGWWGVVPAAVIGFGLVYLLLVVMDKFFGSRHGAREEKRNNSSENDE